MMKILIVCSGNVKNFNFKIHKAFVYEQIEAIKKNYDIYYKVFLVKEKGFKGYLNSFFRLYKELINSNYDIIHSHYGLSGLISVLQLKIPVVVTFHGSDINNSKVNIISSFASILSKWRIFVSDELYHKILMKPKKNFSIIPCGIDFGRFYPVDKKQARKKLAISEDKKYILFTSRFNNPVKNYKLAKYATELVSEKIEIIELKNRTREEVNLLLNACDLLLMTSFSEGSPQIIKEAMACNCPIVSTDVGDVKEIIGDTEGCYLTSFDANDVAEKIKKALKFGRRTNGREQIKHFDNKIIAEKVFKIYHQVIRKNN